MSFSVTRDPQFRRYLGLTGSGVGGIYVNDVSSEARPKRRGCKRAMSFSRWMATPWTRTATISIPNTAASPWLTFSPRAISSGEKLTFTIARKGETKEIPMTLAHRDVESYVVEPYVLDRAPKFYILGGLVLQELSRQYLKEWGNDWVKKAPEQFRLFRSAAERNFSRKVRRRSSSSAGCCRARRPSATRICGRSW